MTQDRKKLRILLRRHEENIELLMAHSHSWDGEGCARASATRKNLTLQIEQLLKTLNKRTGPTAKA